MNKTDATKDTRGKAEEGLIWKKGWNAGFDHVRWMMTFDYSNNKRLI